MKMRTSLVLLLAAGCVLVAGVGQANAEEGAAPECYDCHDEVVLARTPHSALDTEGLAAKAGADYSCAACHGDPAEHIEEGGAEGTIFTFGDDQTAAAVNERCLACHESNHPRFGASPHGQSGMDCTSCHSIHSEEAKFAQLTPWPEFGSQLENARASGSCYECHVDAFTEFRFNEAHKLEQGTVECTDCHNPHQPQTRMLLGGFKQGQCAKCHADKEGPYMFEHGSVRVEGCTSCHSPHGSPNRHMLAFQNVGELCYSCHALVPGFHQRFTLESQCTNCHSSIHGSNLDAFFLR